MIQLEIVNVNTIVSLLKNATTIKIDLNVSVTKIYVGKEVKLLKEIQVSTQQPKNKMNTFSI